ncbi:MAG TPA: LysM peptidoglycan-binding domain-containing protein [Firmicutes bacterium]|nr:LysM peptidoglycan-binding domain-containing protein [Candidatus Fermentithermobacillaceae bacterium]
MSSLPEGTFSHAIRPFDTLPRLARKYGTTESAILELNPGMNPGSLQAGHTINICPGYTSRRSRISRTQLHLNNLIRLLWEQHVFWTRLAIISIVRNLPDASVVIDRLLRNPIDFQMALEPLYGRKIAGMFAALLRDHLVIAAELVTAARDEDTERAADAERRWFENADDIAAFLGRINPHWSEQEWRTMLYEHLKLTKAEAVSQITEDFSAGISLFDDIEEQALEMADVMTQGIIDQFPQRFRA